MSTVVRAWFRLDPVGRVWGSLTALAVGATICLTTAPINSTPPGSPAHRLAVAVTGAATIVALILAWQVGRWLAGRRLSTLGLLSRRAVPARQVAIVVLSEVALAAAPAAVLAAVPATRPGTLVGAVVAGAIVCQLPSVMRLAGLRPGGLGGRFAAAWVTAALATGVLVAAVVGVGSWSHTVADQGVARVGAQLRVDRTPAPVTLHGSPPLAAAYVAAAELGDLEATLVAVDPTGADALADPSGAAAALPHAVPAGVPIGTVTDDAGLVVTLTVDTGADPGRGDLMVTGWFVDDRGRPVAATGPAWPNLPGPRTVRLTADLDAGRWTWAALDLRVTNPTVGVQHITVSTDAVTLNGLPIADRSAGSASPSTRAPTEAVDGRWRSGPVTAPFGVPLPEVAVSGGGWPSMSVATRPAPGAPAISIRVLAGDHPGRLGVIVSADLVRAAQLRIGSEVTVVVGGFRLPARVIGSSRIIPGCPGSGLLTDLVSLSQVSLAAGVTPREPLTTFARAPDPGSLPGDAAVTTMAGTVHALSHHSGAPQAGWTVSAVATILILAIGSLILTATLPGRSPGRHSRTVLVGAISAVLTGAVVGWMVGAVLVPELASAWLAQVVL